MIYSFILLDFFLCHFTRQAIENSDVFNERSLALECMKLRKPMGLFIYMGV
jgi:hypothetical protein